MYAYISFSRPMTRQDSACDILGAQDAQPSSLRHHRHICTMFEEYVVAAVAAVGGRGMETKEEKISTMFFPSPGRHASGRYAHC